MGKVPIPASGFGSIKHWHCSMRCRARHRSRGTKCSGAGANEYDRYYCQEGYSCLLDDPRAFRRRFGER